MKKKIFPWLIRLLFVLLLSAAGYFGFLLWMKYGKSMKLDWNAIAAIGQVLGAAATFWAAWIALKQAKEAKEIAQDSTKPKLSIRFFLDLDQNEMLFVATNVKPISVFITDYTIYFNSPIHPLYKIYNGDTTGDSFPKLLQPGEGVVVKIKYSTFFRSYLRNFMMDLPQDYPFPHEYEFKVVFIDSLQNYHTSTYLYTDLSKDQCTVKLIKEEIESQSDSNSEYYRVYPFHHRWKDEMLDVIDKSKIYKRTYTEEQLRKVVNEKKIKEFLEPAQLRLDYDDPGGYYFEVLDDEIFLQLANILYEQTKEEIQKFPNMKEKLIKQYRTQINMMLEKYIWKDFANSSVYDKNPEEWWSDDIENRDAFKQLKEFLDKFSAEK